MMTNLYCEWFQAFLDSLKSSYAKVYIFDEKGRHFWKKKSQGEEGHTVTVCNQAWCHS